MVRLVAVLITLGGVAAAAAGASGSGAAAAGASGSGAAAGGTLGFLKNARATSQKPAGWDEPSAIAVADDQLFVASQNPELSGNPGSPDLTLSFSTNSLRWSEDKQYYTYESGRPEGTTGDVTMTSDNAHTVFVGHLTRALQTDIDWSRDGGKSWHTADDVAKLPSPGGASGQPFLVDRPWIGAYSPDTNFKHTDVYLEYHDFVTSDVYIVTCSMATGSLQCGMPVAVSNPQTACNSIPGGVAISPKGSKHPGRVYAVWSTADPQTNLSSGCNYTQLAPFYAIYVAWSDHPSNSGSWHQAPVYIGPTGSAQKCPDTALVAGVSTNTCADVSELFTPVAVDQAGNAYVAFDDYVSTLHKHYDIYVARSTDGGNTWDGRTDGKGKPVLVSNDGGTHFIPNLATGSAGRVAVVYYTTTYSDRPFIKGDTCPSGVPPENPCQGKARPEPPSAKWVVDVAESTNGASAHPHFVQRQASDAGVVVHYGDICNLGIYCDGSSTGNRSLFENNSVFTDENGYLVVAWGDQRLDKQAKAEAASSSAQSLQEAHDNIYVACQDSGPSLFAHPASLDRREMKGRVRCGI